MHVSSNRLLTIGAASGILSTTSTSKKQSPGLKHIAVLCPDHALDARQTLPGHPEICSLNSFWVIRDKSRVKKVAATSIFDAGRKSTNHFLLVPTGK